MADILGVGPGAEVVVVAAATDGSLGNDLYRVSGVFETGMAGLDGSLGILPIRSLQELMAMPENRIHEVRAAGEDPFAAPALGNSLGAALAGRGLD